MALLMRSGPAALPPSAYGYALSFGGAGVCLALLDSLLLACRAACAHLVPSAISVGIGMYLTPDWTLPRVAGALAELAWRRTHPASHRRSMLVVASGLVLGEGVWSIAALFLKAAGWIG